jgi:DNA-binding transcriptional LysR family regulator
MIDNSFDLNLIRLFVKMVESKTLTAAAAASGMTRSNVSRSLKALELRLNAQLMLRTTRHIELTEAGRHLYAHGLRMLDEMQAAASSIDSLGQTVRGDVRIRLPTGLGHLYLTPVLMDFARQYPDISLRVLINDYIADVISAEVDVALKVTSRPPEDHVARRICDVGWCLCATPEFLSRQEPVVHAQDLTRCDLIAPASMGRHFDLKLRASGSPLALRVTPRIQSGDYRFIYEAMTAGLGIALLPRYAVWRQLAAGQVIEVLGDYDPEGVGDGIYMLTASNRFPALATRTLMDFIRRHLEEQQKNWARSTQTAEGVAQPGGG